MLNDKQIAYVLFHLNLQVNLSEELKGLFSYQSGTKSLNVSGKKIIFPISEKQLNVEQYISIENIPVLFPLSDSRDIYRWEKDCLVFNHDFLSSAFYLLSGEQEIRSPKRDRYNRFPYEGSVQQRLGITTIPVVNYYFEFIGRGIEAYCEKHKIGFSGEGIFNAPGFILTHDVDTVDTYTFNELIFKFKQITGLAKSKVKFKKRMVFFLDYLRHVLNPFDKSNPHWDFDYLLESAKKRNFKSVFYFLHRDLKHEDSYYEFKEPRFIELFKYLKKEGCEIGLHGSTRTATHQSIMHHQLHELEKYSACTVTGIRQHRLIHQHALTANIQLNSGLLYDASLGFAEHIGYRNSFCYPFRLYDFEKEKMLDLWQIPLVVMDATLYMYVKNIPAKETLFALIDSGRKFNGLFTLLWHNGNFDKENYPGAKELYEKILDYLNQQSVRSYTGDELVRELLDKYVESGK